MKIALDNEKPVKDVPFPKQYERQFAKLMRDMTEAMARHYANNTIAKLNVSTVEKFDAGQFLDGLLVSGSYSKKVIDHYKDVKKYPYITTDEALRITEDDFESMSWTDRVPIFKVVNCNVVDLTVNDFLKSPVELVSDISMSDSQIGNYANIFLALSKKAKRAILKRFNNDRIDSEVKKILTKMDKTTSENLYSNIGSIIGFDSKVISQQAGVTPQIAALIAESQEWVKRLRDENLALFQNATLRAMAIGSGIEEIKKQYDGLTKDRVNRAQFTARQQAATFNNMSQRVRAQKLGIKKGVWVTSRDERVRPSHNDREGKEFNLSEGLYSSLDRKHLHTGEDWNCRCITRFVIPSNDE